MYVFSLLYTQTVTHTLTQIYSAFAVAKEQMQIIRKLNQRRKQIWTQLICLMPLSLTVSFTLHTAFFLSLSFTHVHTQKHLHNRKSDCFNFLPCPTLFSLPSPLPCQEDLHALFFWLFYAETVLLCRPPPPPRPCTNTADRRWRRCHDTVACRPTNPSQSASQPAPSGPVCVFETVLSFGVCVCVFYGLCICMCGSVMLHECCVYFSLS